jgi:carbon storage regulator
MLVLSRRVGETLVIDQDIEVTVVAVQGDRVRLGIAAPADVRVDRKEVHERRVEFTGEADAPRVVAVRPWGGDQ